MKPSNLPDVLYVDPNPIEWQEPFNGYIGTIARGYGDVPFIRHGAPSPWIDPKVQPIPDSLPGLRMVYVKAIEYDLKYEYTTLLCAGPAKDLQKYALLIGYIILPE